MGAALHSQACIRYKKIHDITLDEGHEYLNSHSDELRATWSTLTCGFSEGAAAV